MEQVRGARNSIRRLPDHAERSIHEARQHSKKLRALLRLVRPGLVPAGSFRANDDVARRVARRIASQRDAEVALATLRTLEQNNRWAIDRDPIERVEHHLERSAGRVAGKRALARARKDCLDLLDRQEELVADWRFRSGARRAIEAGFARTRKSARRWMLRTDRSRKPEDFHHWRKHVKYHLYHLRLVARAVDEDLAPRIRQADRLQKILGECHDLAVLDGIVAGLDSPARKHRDAIRELIGDAARTRGEQALRVGQRLLQARPEPRN
jgi:hypothetical protein